VADLTFLSFFDKPKVEKEKGGRRK